MHNVIFFNKTIRVMSIFLFFIIIQNLISFVESHLSLSSTSPLVSKKIIENNFYPINDNYQIYVRIAQSDYNPCKENYNLIKYNDKMYCARDCYIDSVPTNNPFKCKRITDYARGSGYYSEKECIKQSGDNYCEIFNVLWFPKCKYGMKNDGCCVCEGSKECKGKNLGYQTDGLYCKVPYYEFNIEE